MTRFPAVYNSQESQHLQSIGQNLILLTYVIGLHPDWAILWEITLELWWIVSRISSFKAESKPVGDGTVATSILYILVYNLRPVKQHWAERPIHSKNKWRPLQWKAWRSITKQTHPFDVHMLLTTGSHCPQMTLDKVLKLSSLFMIILISYGNRGFHIFWLTLWLKAELQLFHLNSIGD